MRPPFSLFLLLALGVVTGGAPSRADTLTFDADTTPPATDGAGTWDTATANWYNGTADVAWPNTNDTAAFGAGLAGTYAVGVGTVRAGAITFNQGGYTLSGGTITMAPVNAAAGFTLATNGGTSALVTPLDGPANSKITKTGPGVLVLSTVLAPTAAATITGGAFNGTTRLFDSVLQVAFGNAIGVLPATPTVQYILDAGTLRFSGGGAIALAANRSVQVNAAGGALHDSAGNNSFFGQILNNAGAGSSLYFSTAGGATSTLANTAIISGAGSFTFNGPGTAILQGINTYTGGTTVNAGTLTLAAGGGSGTVRGPVTVNPGATLSLTASDALGFTAGTQVTTLNINGGTVDNRALAASGNRNQGYRTALNLTGGTFSNTGGGIFRMAVGDATAPGITSNASATTSTITPNIDIVNGTLAINVASGFTPSGIDLQAAGFFTAAGSLTKSGPGVLALNGGSTYGGATAINAGSLVLNPFLTTVSGGAGKAQQIKSSLVGQGASLPNSAITLAPAASLRLVAGDLPVTLGAAPGAVAPLSGNITATGLNSLRVATGATISPGTYDVLTTNQANLGLGTFQLDGATSLAVPALSFIKQFGGVTNAGGTTGGAFYRLALQRTDTAVQVVVTPAPANVINIMPIGSSTTEGVSSQPDGYSGGGYRSGLYQALVNDGRFTPNFVGSNTVLDQAASGAYNVLSAANQLHHEGHGGYTSNQVLTSLNYGASWLATNPAGQPTNGVVPDYITLAIGTNDLSILAQNTAPHPIPAASLVAPINRTDATLTYIANVLRPNANIILGNLFYRVEGNTIEVVGDLHNQYYNPFVPTVVFNHVLAGHHVTMADLYTAVTPGNNTTQVGPDGIHALTTGYNLMANVWYNALAFGSAYWTGGQDNQWSTVNAGATNFAQNYQLTTPRQTALTAAADVHFNSNAAALATTLGQDVAVRGVNFAAGAVGPVTVGGANTLTLGVGGITAQAGTGAHSILSNVALGADQTWGNVSSNPFVVSGVISGSSALKLTAAYTIYDQVNAANNSDAVVARTFTGPGSFVLSGANTYTGGTTLSSGTLVVNNASGSATGPGNVTVGAGATLTDNGAIGGSVVVNGTTNGAGTFDGAVTVNSGGVFGTAGTVNGSLTVGPGGLLMLAGGALTGNGAVVNNGTIRLERGAALTIGAGGSFTNNGVLDIITGSLNAPAGFTNNGVVIDSSVVKTNSATLANGVFTVTVNGYTGHTYQLQSSASPAGDTFTNLGAAQSGTTGSVLTFTDPNPAAPQNFYRVQVDQ